MANARGRRSGFAWLGLGAAGAVLMAGPAGATTAYTLTLIPDPPQTVDGLAGLNNSGEAVINYGEGAGGAFTYQYPGGAEAPITPTLIAGGGTQQIVAAGGINSSGVIVGTYQQLTNNVDNDFVGFIDKAGTFTYFSPPTSIATQGLGISDSGIAWGLYNTAGGNGNQTYFTYNPITNAYTVPSSSGYSDITIVGVDSAGTIFGNAERGGIRVGFEDNGGVFTQLLEPGGLDTSIEAISQSGLVSGIALVCSPTCHNLPFVYDSNNPSGGYQQIGLPGENASIGAINNNGLVALSENNAWYVEDDGVFSPVALPYDPNDNEVIDAINLGGLIGGSEYSGNGFNYQYTAFIGSPTPEPAAWSLVIVGLGLTGAALRRQGRRQIVLARAVRARR
jgi:hypothetical protein